MSAITTEQIVESLGYCYTTEKDLSPSCVKVQHLVMATVFNEVSGSDRVVTLVRREIGQYACRVIPRSISLRTLSIIFHLVFKLRLPTWYHLTDNKRLISEVNETTNCGDRTTEHNLSMDELIAEACEINSFFSVNLKESYLPYFKQLKLLNVNYEVVSKEILYRTDKISDDQLKALLKDVTVLSKLLVEKLWLSGRITNQELFYDLLIEHKVRIHVITKESTWKEQSKYLTAFDYTEDSYNKSKIREFGISVFKNDPEVIKGYVKDLFTRFYFRDLGDLGDLVEDIPCSRKYIIEYLIANPQTKEQKKAQDLIIKLIKKCGVENIEMLPNNPSFEVLDALVEAVRDEQKISSQVFKYLLSLRWDRDRIVCYIISVYQLNESLVLGDNIFDYLYPGKDGVFKYRSRSLVEAMMCREKGFVGKNGQTYLHIAAQLKMTGKYEDYRQDVSCRDSAQKYPYDYDQTLYLLPLAFLSSQTSRETLINSGSD